MLNFSIEARSKNIKKTETDIAEVATASRRREISQPPKMPSDASMLPRLENPLLSWKDMTKTATVFSAVNLFMLLIWLEVPLMILAIQYGGYMALALGFIGSKLRLIDTVDLDAASTAFVAQLRELFGLFLDMALTPVVKKLAPIVVWSDITTSLLVLLCIYVFSGVVTTMGLFECVFLAFNVVFVYGKLQTEVIKAADPHLAKAKKAVVDAIGMIPKYEGSTSSSTAGAAKKASPAPAASQSQAEANGSGSAKKNSPKKEPAAAPAPSPPEKESVKSEAPSEPAPAAPVAEEAEAEAALGDSAQASTSENAEES